LALQELKHAQDVKLMYEKKLEKVNSLFMELNAWKLQLEEAEKILAKKERRINNQVWEGFFVAKYGHFYIFVSKLRFPKLIIKRNDFILWFLKP